MISARSPILNALPDRVTRIVLYGSVARGTGTQESDVDIAVFLSAPMDHRAEDRLSEAVVDMNLKYDKVFSVIDIENAVYQKWRGGIVLWTAA